VSERRWQIHGSKRRVTLGFFLAWIAAFPVLLRCYANAFRIGSPPGPWQFTYSPFQMRYWGAMSAAGSVFLVGGGWLLWDRWRSDARGVPLPRFQPGHWLLILGTTSPIGYAAGLMAYQTLPRELGPHLACAQYDFPIIPTFQAATFEAIAWGIGAVFAVAIVGLAWSACEVHWRAMLLSLAATATAMAICGVVAIVARWTGDWNRSVSQPSSVLGWLCPLWLRLYPGLILLSAASLMLASGVDLTRRVRRDAFHWLGVGAWFAIAGIQLLLPVMVTWS
jgi:hypothetical protein